MDGEVAALQLLPAPQGGEIEVAVADQHPRVAADPRAVFKPDAVIADGQRGFGIVMRQRIHPAPARRRSVARGSRAAPLATGTSQAESAAPRELVASTPASLQSGPAPLR